MRAILVFTCFIALACAGCGNDSSDSDGGTGGSGASTGTGGTGNSSGSADCQRICESPCIGDVLDPGEVADCVQACEMDGNPLSDCASETVAVLDCIEDFNCEGDAQCLSQFTAFAQCFSGSGFSF